MTQQSLLQVFRFSGLKKRLRPARTLFWNKYKTPQLVEFQDSSDTHVHTLPNPPPTPHVFSLEDSDTSEQCYMTF